MGSIRIKHIIKINYSQALHKQKDHKGTTMERDNVLFPDNAIGNALWVMVSEGDDLSQTREMEFSVIFKEKANALKFGHLLLENNQKLSFCPYDENPEYPWEITAYPHVSATYENISTYINLLSQGAEPLAGKFDDWYCVTANPLA